MARRSLLHTLLSPRVAALRAAVPGAVAGDPDAVHRARVASRRLREVLPPLRDVVPDGAVERARHEVRRWTRALGPLRELDVTLGLFDQAAVVHALDAAAGARMRRALLVERDAALRHLRAVAVSNRRARMLAALDRLALHDVPPEADAVVLSALTLRVERRSARLRRALDRAGAVYVPERLHRVRIAVKQLRYALEVLAHGRRRPATARLAQLKAIQDLLGRAHDQHVLAERLGVVQARVVRSSRAIAAELGRLATALDGACRADHAAFMTRRQGLLTLCNALDAAAAAPRRRSVA